MRLYTKEQIEEYLAQNKNRFYVYGLWRPDKQNIFYIGKGRSSRVFGHFKVSDGAHNLRKQNIIRIVGIENVRFWIRFCEDEKSAFDMERTLIAQYGRKQLCNLTEGGEGASGRACSEETKQKLKARKVGYVPDGEAIKRGWTPEKRRVHSVLQKKLAAERTYTAEQRKRFGHRKGIKLSFDNIENMKKSWTLERREEYSDRLKKSWTPEKRKALSELQTGKKLSLEARRKISEGNKGKIMSLEARRKLSNIGKGKIIPEETRVKISNTLKNRVFSDETKKKISEKIKLHWKVRLANKNN